MSEKPLNWLGNSKKIYDEFSEETKDDLGYNLGRVQNNEVPQDFKPMTTVGKGVYELRFSDGKTFSRVMYIAKFEEAVYVLHAFEKKTNSTEKQDIDLAKTRLKELISNR